MKKYHGLTRPQKPDWQGLVDNILRKGTPRRVHHMELFQDFEISQGIAARFDLAAGIDPGDPDFMRKKYIAVQRFCGFDYAAAALRQGWVFHNQVIDDVAAAPHKNGRSYRDEHTGPIASWEDFEKYPWPDPTIPEATLDLEWYQQNLPDDMCIVAIGTGHFAEFITWLMGYESLCYALYDNRDLVKAIADRLVEYFRAALEQILRFDRVKMIFASDDMGFRGGLLISPADAREFWLPGHKALAEMSHAAGRPYLLHSCGNLYDVIDDLIDDVKIDAKHSFEDTIEDVRQVKGTYGRRIALIGGIDVDFLCRADEQAIRKRVRETLDVCLPGGGFCLGSGNSVANYIPLDNYLAMLDEGQLYGR